MAMSIQKMVNFSFVISLLLILMQPNDLHAQESRIPLPSAAQLRWQAGERIMFVHYGPAAWQSREYDNFTTPLSRLKMEKLDTDQWCRVAKSWGARMIIFVAKHCGGFCWWQTETTDYGIKETPWRNGKGDVMKCLSESCAKYGLDLGVYIYPGDDRWGAGIGSGGITNDPNKQEAYNKIFRQQLLEVLTKYGPIREIWFDGNCKIEVKDILDKYASDAVIFQGECANLRWVGNEEGYAPYPNWYTVKDKDVRTGSATALHSDVNGDRYAPVEVDVPLLKNGGHKWFWAPGCDSLLMTTDQLMNIYYKSVGRGSVLLLNSTPDTTGVIPQTHADVYKAFGKEIAARFDKPVASVSGMGTAFEVKFDKARNINHVILQEDLSKGQRVLAYEIIVSRDGVHWKTIYKGSSIGNKKIDCFPTISLKALKVHITNSKATPCIKKMAVYNVSGDFSKQMGAGQKGNGSIAGTWQPDTFKADSWTNFEIDLTPYLTEVGEYEVTFSKLASDYIVGKSSDLDFKDIELTMYGGVHNSAVTFIPQKQIFRITHSQQTLNEFPTILKAKVKTKGATSIGEIIVRKVAY